MSPLIICSPKDSSILQSPSLLDTPATPENTYAHLSSTSSSVLSDDDPEIEGSSFSLEVTPSATESFYDDCDFQLIENELLPCQNSQSQATFPHFIFDENTQTLMVRECWTLILAQENYEAPLDVVTSFDPLDVLDAFVDSDDLD